MPSLTLSSGARLNYAEIGSGTPLVLIHGSPGDGRAWSRVTKHLLPNTRILIPDLPGYGESDPLARGLTRRTEAIAVAIGELIDLCCEPAWLCGHSYGGNVALHAAVCRREHVAGLALFEPVFVRALDLVGDRSSRVDAQAFCTTYLARVELAEPDAIGLMIDFWSGAGSYAKMSERQKHFLNEAAAKNAEDVRASFAEVITARQLASFDRPVIIGCGGESPPLAAKIAGALARLLPGAELRSLPGPAHNMLDSHPFEVATSIDGFRELRVLAGTALG